MFIPGSATTPGVSIEVFIEQDQILPVGVGLIHLRVSMAWPPTVLVGRENAGDPSTQVLRDVQQVDFVSGAGWIVHFQIVSVEVVVALQALDDQEINCKCKPYPCQSKHKVRIQVRRAHRTAILVPASCCCPQKGKCCFLLARS